LAKSESDTRATKIRRIVYKEESVAKDENEGAQKMSASKVEEELQKDVKPDDMSSVVIPEQTADAEPTTGTAPSGEPAKVSRSVSLKVSDEAKVVRSVSLTVEDPVDAGRRAPSPPRRPPSNIIHVTGLVRPYTLGQLKELLGRTGTLVPDGFWIDSIKSHCYVTYETVEQAVATREALHGKRWPASNPKFLGIEFRTAEELEFRKSNNAAPRPAAKLASEQPQPAASKEPEKSRIGREAHPDASKDPARVSRDSAKPRQSPKGTKEKAASPSQQPLREWDRHKLKQPSRSKSRERRPKEDMAKRERDRKEVDRRRDQRDRQKEDRRPRDRTDKPAVAGAAKVEEEPPAKLLDDLFRKTKAAPSIYWLPLTDEQVAEKMAQEKERAATKERMRIEREQQMEVERQQRQKAREERERAREAEHGGRLSHRKFSEEGPSRRKSRSRADRN
jgi:apoptotic chromatin condensation inducer in the nucleus